jgi:hypothetical protein
MSTTESAQTDDCPHAPLALVIGASCGIGRSSVGEFGDRFVETDLDPDLKLVDLDGRSTVQLATLLARDMAAQGAGRISFTASIAAATPGPFRATVTTHLPDTVTSKVHARMSEPEDG